MLKPAAPLPGTPSKSYIGVQVNKASALHACLICAVLLGLSACAQAPKKVVKRAAAPLVFPLPPDQARFFYERTIRGSRDVDASIVGNSLQDMLTGKSSGEMNVPLRKPYAVVVHKGRIFVSEPTTRVVRVFDVPKRKFFSIGQGGRGALQMPLGLAVDGSGNLYVADISAAAVMVYNRDGLFLRRVTAKTGEPALFKRLTSVAVDKKGEKLYALDIGGTSATREFHRVRVFNAKTGAHLFDIGKRGAGPGDLNLARDLVLDKDNNLIVLDGGNARVQVFSAEGKFLRQFGGRGRQFGDFSRPKEIALDPSGNIYVSDATFSHFQIFTPDGQLLLAIGTGSVRDVPAKYNLVSGLDVDEDGRIYFVDQQFRKIDIFRPADLSVKQGYLAGNPVDNKVGSEPSQTPVSTELPASLESAGQAADGEPATEEISDDESQANKNEQLMDELLSDVELLPE